MTSTDGTYLHRALSQTDEAYTERLRAAWDALTGPARARVELRRGDTWEGPWFGVVGTDPVMVDTGPRSGESAHRAVPVSGVAAVTVVPETVQVPRGHGVLASLAVRHLDRDDRHVLLDALWDATPPGAWIILHGAHEPMRGPWHGMGVFHEGRVRAVALDPLPGRRDGRVDVVKVALRTIRHVTVTMPPLDERSELRPTGA